MKNKKWSKLGQLSIFAIIGIIILAVIISYFALSKMDFIKTSIEEPKSYIQGCIEESLEEAEKKILESNGYVDEEITNTISYEGKKVPYLCSASEFYIPCMPQDPMIIEKVREKITKDVGERTNACFSKIKKEYERKGYKIQEGEMNVEIIFNNYDLYANIKKELVVTKDEQTQKYDIFRGKISSPLYNLFYTATKIVNFESSFCEFNNINWVLNYPEIIINRFRANDQTKIYILRHKDSEKEIKFAIKTCVLPAGL